jgi:hypothetical protein
MVLSDDKISHIAHLIQRGLDKDPRVKLLVPSPQVLKEIKRALIGELRLDDEIDVHVRRRLSSYSRRIVEGSSEWEVLYKKAFEEEMKRRRRIG